MKQNGWESFRGHLHATLLTQERGFKPGMHKTALMFPSSRVHHQRTFLYHYGSVRRVPRALLGESLLELSGL